MIERIAAYLPADRLFAVAAGEELPDRARGAALSADLAGFTAFTDALARRHGLREGPELLTRQLNTIYDGLVAEVDAAGGSVVGFAGDGFTVWFDETRGAAAPRAVSCGLALQRRFAEWAAAEEGRSALGLRVAVTSGPVRRFKVGDASVHVLDVLAGDTMARLGAADAVAEKGEVVADAATAEALPGRLEAGATRADEKGRSVVVVKRLSGDVRPAPWPERPAGLGAASLRAWLLPSVFERLSAGQADFLAELRPAAALFLGFEGIDYDADPEAGARLDAFVRRVQSILGRYDGSLLQLTIGDKGSYLYASFGAPVAHEDDAFRAVRAAVRLSRGAADPEMPGVRIGVSHGVMRAGAYGGTRRRTYGALGEEVNLAARLMQKAKGGVPLFSARVTAATRDLVRWEALEPVRVKGREEPVPVYRAVGAREPEAPSASRIVGRDDERTVMAWAVEAAMGGEGGTLLIEGEAGLGKSRLVEEVLDRSAAAGLSVLVGAGDAIERHQPYHAWRPVFEALLGLHGEGRRGGRAISGTIGLTSQTRIRIGAGSSERPRLSPADAARVVARVAEAGPGLEAMAPLVNAVLEREIPEAEATKALAPPARAARTLDVLSALLRRAAGRAPLVVVLEDCHCFDSASWALALRAAQTESVLVVLATRPLEDASPPELTAIRELPGTHTIELRPLDREAIEAVAASVLGASRLAAPLATAVRARAEGSPLVALEVARALNERGLVEVVDGEARPTSSAAAALEALPGTVEGVVLGRVDRLGPLAQRVLKVGAVIGRAFSWRALADAVRSVEGSSAGERALPPALLELERAGLVEALAVDQEPAWAFRSALVQEVVYNLMGSEQRRELHHAVAEWFESSSVARPAAELAVVAHHWVRAGRMLRAQPYLERAADATLRAGAWAEAARLYTMLIETAEGSAADTAARLRQAGWRSQLGAAEAGAGRIPEARRHIEASLERLGLPVGGGVVRVAVAAGTHDLLRRVAPFLRRGGDDPGRAEATRAYERLAELHYLSDAPRDAFREALRGLEMALLTGQEGVRTRLQAVVSVALSIVPMRSIAGRLITDAIAGARATGEPDTLAWVLEMAALQAFAAGSWKETAAQLDEALALSERTGDRRRALELRTIRGWALLTHGELRAAGPFFSELERDAASEGDHRSRSAAGTGRAVAALRTDEVASGLSIVRGRRAPVILPLSHALLGEREEALKALPEAVAQARARPVKCWGLERFALPAEAALMLWETEAGKEPGEKARIVALTREAVAASARFARVFPIGVPRAALLAGTAAWLDGRTNAAQAAWNRALSAGRRLEMPYEEARARLEIGRHSPKGSRERALQLDRAAAIFEEVGAHGGLGRVERERRE